MTTREERAALRAQIPVAYVKGDGKETKEETKTEETTTTEETVVAANEETTTTEENKETVETNNEEIKANEKTAEELETEKAAATTQKEKDRIQRRIDRITAKSAKLEEENAELKRQLAAKPKEGLTEEEIERRSDVKAEEKAVQRQFANDCNKLFNDATKLDKEFKKKIDSVVDELGGVEAAGIPGQMIGILSDIDNGGAVLSHLANDIDLYEEVRALSLSKMANRLNKISNELEKAAEEGKKKPKEPSKVPDPVQAIRGSNSSPGTYTQGMSMDAYVTLRNKQKAEREQRRKAGLRA